MKSNSSQYANCKWITIWPGILHNILYTYSNAHTTIHRCTYSPLSYTMQYMYLLCHYTQDAVFFTMCNSKNTRNLMVDGTCYHHLPWVTFLHQIWILTENWGSSLKRNYGHNLQKTCFSTNQDKTQYAIELLHDAIPILNQETALHKLIHHIMAIAKVMESMNFVF